MESIAERMKLARKSRDYTQAKLAKLTKLSQGTIAQLETGRSDNSKYLPQIAEKLQVNYQWLLTGAGDMNQMSSVKVDTGIRRIPLRSWSDLGDKAPAVIEWIPAPTNVSNDAYAVVVEGEAMIGTGRSYPPGTIIIVDPSVPATSGCRVIALCDGNYTFREMRSDSGKDYLIPLNPQFPTIIKTDYDQIVGRVVGSYLPE